MVGKQTASVYKATLAVLAVAISMLGSDVYANGRRFRAAAERGRLANHQTVALSVFYTNNADLSRQEINEACKHARQVFGNPVTCSPMDSANLSTPYLQVNFTNKKLEGSDERSGGETVPSAREAWVYAPSVYNPGAQDFTQQSDLNHAFSHELGHLMGLEHSSNGLMNPNFNASDQRADVGDYLSKAQRQQVQKYLESLPLSSLDQ